MIKEKALPVQAKIGIFEGIITPNHDFFYLRHETKMQGRKRELVCYKLNACEHGVTGFDRVRDNILSYGNKCTLLQKTDHGVPLRFGHVAIDHRDLSLPEGKRCVRDNSKM